MVWTFGTAKETKATTREERRLGCSEGGHEVELVGKKRMLRTDGWLVATSRGKA